MQLEESLVKFIQYLMNQAGKFADNYAMGVNPESPNWIDFLYVKSEGEKPEHLFSVSHEFSAGTGFYVIYYQNQIILTRFINIAKFDESKTIRFSENKKIIFELEYADS